jgi:hypothetical protein
MTNDEKVSIELSAAEVLRVSTATLEAERAKVALEDAELALRAAQRRVAETLLGIAKRAGADDEAANRALTMVERGGTVFLEEIPDPREPAEAPEKKEELPPPPELVPEDAEAAE